MLLQAIRAIHSSLGADAVAEVQTLQLGNVRHSLWSVRGTLCRSQLVPWRVLALPQWQNRCCTSHIATAGVQKRRRALLKQAHSKGTPGHFFHLPNQVTHPQVCWRTAPAEPSGCQRAVPGGVWPAVGMTRAPEFSFQLHVWTVYLGQVMNLSIQGDGRGRRLSPVADVGGCHSFGGTPLYMHPLLCLYRLQQSYSPELSDLKAVPACHWSQHKQHSGAPFPWITSGQLPNHHSSYRLRELWGDAAEHKQFCLHIPKTLLSPYAEACSDLVTLHQTVPGCKAGSVWMSRNCGGHGLVGQTWDAEIRAVPLEPKGHHWAAAPKLSLDKRVHTECWVSLSNSAAPQVPLALNVQGPFSLSWKWIKEDT